MTCLRYCPHCQEHTGQGLLPKNAAPDTPGLEFRDGCAYLGFEWVMFLCLRCHRPNAQVWRENAAKLDFREVVKNAGGG